MRAFREFEGLKIMITRLQRELGLSQVEKEGEDSVMEDCHKEKEEETKQPKASNGKPTGKVAAKRFLVKSLLRAIALTCYSNGEWSQSRLTFEGESAGLPSCLHAIFKQAKELGSSVFALAATVLADLLHHDPTCFSIIQKHGLPKAFLETVQNGVLMTPDTVCCLPSTLVALCLNKNGLKDVKASNVLKCLIPIFTNPHHCRALQGDTPSMLGNGIDELIRHVPDTKETCIDVLFEIVDEILNIGKMLKKEKATVKGASKGETSVASQDPNQSNQPMETDDLGSSEKGESSKASAPPTSVEYFESMSEMMSNVARLLEAMLSNPSVGEAFVQRGGVLKLLELYTIPVKNPSPTTVLQLFATFRVLNPSHSKSIGAALITELRNLLREWENQCNMTKLCSYMLEDHLGKTNEEPSHVAEKAPVLSTLHALEGLLSLSGNLLRSSSLMLNGFSIDYSTKLLQLLGSFQTSMIWCSSLFEEIKIHHDNKPIKESTGSEDTPSTSAGMKDDAVVKKKSAETSGQQPGKDEPKNNFPFPKKKPKQPFNEVISRVLVSIRQLFQALARNLHNDRRINRTRDNIPNKPAKEAFNAAACLARLSLDYFTISEKVDEGLTLEKLVIDEGNNLSADYSESLIRRAKVRFISQSMEEISNLLSDYRRKSCNGLLVNAFIRASVLKMTLGCLERHIDLLCAKQNELSAKCNDMFAYQIMQAEEECDLITKVIAKILAFLGTIINPSLLFSNAHTTSLLLASFPEDVMGTVFKDRNITEVELPSESNELQLMLQQEVLEEITKVWKIGLEEKLPQEVLAAMLAIFHTSVQENKITASKPPPKVEKKFVPDESVVEQILAMGFTRRQAEKALVKVRSNNLEIAMEWLLSHPEEAEAEDDDEIARAVAMSLEPKDSKKDSKGQGKVKIASSMKEIRRTSMPTSEEFLKVLFNCINDKKEDIVLANSFALVEVLVRLADDIEEKKEVNTNSVVSFLMSKLSSSCNHLHIFAALHILLLLSCKSSEVRYCALECGVVSKCLELLQTAVADLKSHMQKDEETSKAKLESESSDGLSELSMKRWISPLLLLMDCYLKMIRNPKLPVGASASSSKSKGHQQHQKVLEKLGKSDLQVEVAKHAFYALQSFSQNKFLSGPSSSSVRKECVQSCLQVIATVCRKHSIALKLYEMGILDTLLSVPIECGFPAFDYLVFSILRYIVEDPTTLTVAMEGQIRAIFHSSKFRAQKEVELKALCKSFVVFYSRDKEAFKAAISSVCQLEKKDGKALLSLKPSTLNGHSDESRKRNRSPGKNVDYSDGGGTSSKLAKPFAFPSIVQALLDRISSNVSIFSSKESGDVKKALDGLVERKKHIKYVSLCLSVLTDFCIHYSSCVHYILKADLNMNVLKFVVDNLLPLHSSAVQKNNSSGLNAKNDGSNPSVVAERSSYFLVAVCVRNSEARHRIIQHIASTLRSLPSYSDAEYKPFEVSKLRALLDFIHSLLVTSKNTNALGKQGSRERPKEIDYKGWSKDLMKDMREMKIVEGLVCAINNVELHNPGATKILNTILRPFNIILESLNKSAMSVRMEAKDKKVQPEAGNSVRANVANNSTSPGAERANRANVADPEAAQQALPETDFDRGFAAANAVIAANAARAADEAEDMMNSSDDEDRMDSDLSDSELSDSSDLSDTSSSSSDSSSTSESVSDHDDEDMDEEDAQINEGFEVVVNGDEREGEEMNGHGGDGRDFNEGPVIRVSEVDMDTDSQISRDSDDEEHNNDMMDEEEDDLGFHTTDIQSEDEWSDSPVIEVRVRSPFQNPIQMRFNNGSRSARESVGLQTGIPLLDNFFGALRAQDDGLVELSGFQRPGNPRRLQSLARGNRHPAGLHPLFNPSYNPSPLTGLFTGNLFPDRDLQYGSQNPFPNNLTSLFWESELHSNRVHQRLVNLADTFGLGSSWNIWSSELQNDGFEIFHGSNGSSTNSSVASRGSESKSASIALESRIFEMVMSSVQLKPAEAPVEKKKADSNTKEEPKDPSKKKDVEGTGQGSTSSKKGKGKDQNDNANANNDLPGEGGARPAAERNEDQEQPNQAAPLQQVPAQAPRDPSHGGGPASAPAPQRPQGAPPQAAAAGDPSIDPAFLEALPEDLREEVLTSQRQTSQRERPAPPTGQAQQVVQDLDPEFLAALPPDIQSEVLAQQRSAQNAQNARAQPQAQPSGTEMDIASIIATFPADIREEVLLSLDEGIVSSLPPEILAEAQTARDRANSSRSFQTYTFGNDGGAFSAMTQRNGASTIHRFLVAQSDRNGSQSTKRGNLTNKWSNRREVLSDMQPPITAFGVASVVRLLRVAQSLGKGLMHRVLMNICGHSQSCKHLLACFSEILGCALQESGGKKESETSKKDKNGISPQFKLYGCQGDAYYAQKSSYCVPSLVLHRVIHLLMYLIKHDPEISSILMTSFIDKKAVVAKDKKGKSTAKRKGSLTGDKITILEQLFQLLSREFSNNGGMFDLLLQLIEGILADVSRKVSNDQKNTAASTEGKETKTKRSEYQRHLASLADPLLASLPRFLTANVERASSDHLQKIMIDACKILPAEYTKKMIDALAEEGKKVISQCESEISQDMAHKDTSTLSIKSGFILLKMASNIDSLSAMEGFAKKFKLQQNEGFMSFQEAAQVLWQSLAKHAVGLESMLKKIAPKEGEAPIAPQSILPYFPLVEAFAILSSIAEKRTAADAADAAEVVAAADTQKLNFLVFAEKHSLLVNSLIRHDPSCLEENFKVLLKHPRLIEFENKCSYFRSRISKGSDDHHHGSLRINVRRDCVFEDSFHQLRHRTADEMHGRLNVQFQGEDGVDAGGVTREWYQVMARAIFKEELALFTSGGNGVTFQPNPNSMIQNEGVDHLQYFKFVGRFVAKALLDNQILDAYFTRSLYKHLLGEALSYEDIEAVDPDYFKNLKWMLENDINGVFELNFTAETDYFGKKETVELKPGGTKIPVTNDNKTEYVNLIAKHRMTNAIEAQVKAFLEGFWDLVAKDLLEIFNDKEVELLISGLPEIDIFDMKKHTEYNGYFSNSPVIKWFWEVVQDLSKEDKARLIQFCTGTSKVPLQGFKALIGVSGPQKFNIQKAYGPTSNLPTGHSCFNQLDLVEYESKEQLKEKLLLAIREASEGFGFA
jgi:E3 ubiquitin-protein ligase HUWE1